MSSCVQKHPLRSSDDDFAHSLGKIDKLRLMEPLYRKALIENEMLKAKLRTLQEEPKASDELSQSLSITQHLLNSANIKDLSHPTEFFEVLEKENQEEIELLKEKTRSSKRDIEKAEQQRDDLELRADDLTMELTEKDGKLKELEETLFPATDCKEDRSSRREREEALRGLIRPRFSPDDHHTTMRRRTDAEEEGGGGGGEADNETDLLRGKIEELQQRVAELQHHNEKWKTLCKELHQELSKVKGQLQQYQKAEVSDRAKMMANLRDQEVRTEKAERMALSAKRQIEELEQKVIDLERQLERKERRQREQEQDRINAAEVEEGIRQLREEQLKTFREDFESEKRDHELTKTRLNSLRQEWQSVYGQLKDVNQQLSDANQRLETLKKENRRLETQLEQARHDQLLIRNRASESGLISLYKRLQTSDSTMTGDHPGRLPLSGWDCPKCTFRNGGKSMNCEMCNGTNINEQFPQPLTEIPSYSSEKLSPTKNQLEEDGNCVINPFTMRNDDEESDQH